LLLLFGLGLTLGNALGGWAADRWPGRSMFAILAALIAAELALQAFLALPGAVTMALFLWGMAAFAAAPGLQSRVLDEAADAPALASTLNIAAFNLGNALAAWIGAAALDAGLPVSRLPLLSAGLAAVALLLLYAMRGAQRRASGGVGPSSSPHTRQ
jgi:DHA1 family inner membrane transport protein